MEAALEGLRCGFKEESFNMDIINVYVEFAKICEAIRKSGQLHHGPVQADLPARFAGRLLLILRVTKISLEEIRTVWKTPSLPEYCFWREYCVDWRYATAVRVQIPSSRVTSPSKSLLSLRWTSIFHRVKMKTRKDATSVFHYCRTPYRASHTRPFVFGV